MTSLRFRITLVIVAGLASATDVQAFQFGGMGGPAPQAQARRSGHPETAQARIEVAQEAIKTLDALAKTGNAPKSSDARLLWQRRLVEARIDAGQNRQTVVKEYIAALKGDEAATKAHMEKGEASALQLDEARFRVIEAEGMLHEPAPQAGMMGGMGSGLSGAKILGGGGMMGGGGMGGGMMGGGGMGGGGMGGGGMGGGAMGGGESPAPSRKPSKPHPADIARNKVIEEALETPLAMHFSEETSLEDVIKYIKTSLAKGKPIPIYVDPIGLQEAEKTMASPVTIDLEDVPLRTTLRLALKQLGLDYRVRDGMLYIDAISTFEEEERDPNEKPPAQTQEGGGFTGGFGGGF